MTVPDGAVRAVLPLGSLAVATLALVAAAAGLALDPSVLGGPASAPVMLALLHAVTVGYLALTFAGTLQQLLPVLLVTPLAMPWLGPLGLPALALGAVGVVAGFAMGFRPVLLAVGGALASVGLWAVAVQAVATYVQARRARAGRPAAAHAPAALGPAGSAAGAAGPPDAAAAGLVTATVYLALTVTLGFLLAAATRLPGLAATFGFPVRLHLTLGLFGAFLLGIAAAGRKLLAMFVLSKGTLGTRVRVLTYLVHGAVVSEVLAAFAGLPSRAVSIALLAAAAVLQLAEVRSLVRHRLRRRFEPPVFRYLLAHAFLPLAGGLVVGGRSQAAGTALLLGYLVLATSGMQVKIASFLTWQARYAARGAANGAPLLRDMIRPGLEPVITMGLAGGAVAAVVATLTSGTVAAVVAAVLLAAGASAHLAQTGFVLLGRHESGPSPRPRPVLRKEPS